MSIPFSGTFRRSGGVVSAIGKQLKFVNLKAVHRITFKFDPFSENVKSSRLMNAFSSSNDNDLVRNEYYHSLDDYTTGRDLLCHLSSPKVIETNPKCSVKTEVVCNREPSEVLFTLNQAAQDQHKQKYIKFLSDNLTLLELLQLCNKHVSNLAPKEEQTTTIQTKSEKKSATPTRKILKKK